MTTEVTESIAEMAARYKDLKAALDSGYAELKALEYALISGIREEYPQEFGDWERGVRKFQAEGVSIDLKRSYDMDKLRAEFQEDHADLFELVQKEPEWKADGRKLAQMWKQADLARRLERCLVPAVPKVRVD